MSCLPGLLDLQHVDTTQIIQGNPFGIVNVQILFRFSLGTSPWPQISKTFIEENLKTKTKFYFDQLPRLLVN